ncbi:RDD family protein [Saliphagus sp. GCM10025308]
MDRYPSPDMNERVGVLDRRFEALLIDGILVAVIVGILGYVAGTVFLDGPLGGFGGLLVSLQFGAPVVLVLYQTSFEGYFGQTIGKRARGIVVVRKDGTRCTWTAAVLRNLLRIIDVLPVLYVVGVISAYATGDHQRIGDLAAKTVVVGAD